MSPQAMAAKLQAALDGLIATSQPAQIIANKDGVTVYWPSVEGDREPALFHVVQKEIEAQPVAVLRRTMQQAYDAVVQDRQRGRAQAGWWQQRLQEARVSVV